MILKFLNRILFFTQAKKDRKLIDFVKKFTNSYPNNIDLFKQAFRHRSLYNSVFDNNERLEFLGDAIFQSITSEYLYKKMPHKTEGEMTKLRIDIVNRNKLTTIARDLKLLDLMECSKGLEKLKLKYVEGNTLEALIGSTFIDMGYDKCKEVVIKKLIEPYIQF